jgi:hypothetical protein
MRNLLNFISTAAVVLISIISICGGVPHGNIANGTSQGYEPATTSNQHPPLIGEMKLLAEGSQSAIQEPFIAVCRDDETYLALKKLDGSLPKLAKDFFQSHTVLAAYLGTRNTGGYGIEIVRKGDPNINFSDPNRTRFEVSEKALAKDAMVTQVITAPFKIVSLEVNGTPPIILSIGYAWRQKQQLYRIKSGTFSTGGGFAGTSEQFEPHGELLTLQTRDLVSFYISMRGIGGSKERFLSDFATGTIQKDALTIKRMTADFFVDGPNAGFSANGAFKVRDGRLSLRLGSLPAIVSDGYSGAGSLEAELVPASTKQ